MRSASDPRAAPDQLSPSENVDGRGLPRPSGVAVSQTGYFAGGVTCTCMKPPGVTLVTRIEVPVFGTLTLFHSAW